MAGTIITLSSILCDKLNVPMVHCAILLDRSRSRSPRGGGGVSPHNGLYGEVSPERCTFYRLQVCERVGKSVIWVCERAQRANR